MGNNQISGPLPASLGRLTNLQRIVLHQNKLSGPVPSSFWELGCIVNLAGNPALRHGPDVSAEERSALISLYNATNGPNWTCNTGSSCILLSYSHKAGRKKTSKFPSGIKLVFLGQEFTVL